MNSKRPSTCNTVLWLVLPIMLVARNAASIPWKAVMDRWEAPAPRFYTSQDGKWALKVVPDQKRVNQKGWPEKATGSLVMLNADGTEQVVWSRELVNVPVDVKIYGRDKPYTVTKDSWANGGYKHSLVLYAPDGSIVRDYALEDLLTKEEIEKHAPASDCCRWWGQGLNLGLVKPGISFGQPFPQDESMLRLEFGWGKAILIELATGKMPLLWESKDERFLQSIKFSPNGKFLVTGGNVENSPINLRDVRSGQVIRTLTKGAALGPDTVAFSPDGKMIALVKGHLELWDVETGQPVASNTSQQDQIRSVTFSPDGKLIVTGLSTGEIKFWNRHTGELPRTLRASNDSVEAIDISLDGKIMVSGTTESVTMWDMQTSMKIRAIPTGAQVVTFSPDGQTLAIGRRDTQVFLFSVKSGERTGDFLGYNGDGSITFSPDGNLLAITSRNLIARGNELINIWDMQTGKIKHQLKGHTGSILAAAFSPDGKTLASCGVEDGTVKLWRLE